MRRYQGEYDEEMAQARQRAAESQRRYDEEQEQAYEEWKRKNLQYAEKPFFDQEGKWDFTPLREADGHVSGYKVYLNGHFVALVVPVRNDLVVLMKDDEGVRAQYRRGRAIDAQNVIDAFVTKQLEEG